MNSPTTLEGPRSLRNSLALSWFASEMTVAWLSAAVAVALLMAVAGRYGYFRDELYYIALSKHLDWGFVDLAPLSPLVLRIVRSLSGDSLHAIRSLPALAQAAEIVLTGLIARELGGHRPAILLSSLSVLFAPVILANANRYSMNAFEPLFWMGCVYLLLLAINREQSKMLVGCGVLLGIGLENKHSTAFFLISLTAALLLTRERRLFRAKWLWIAAVIIVLLCLPNLIWQYQHDFATWVDLTNVRETHKNVELPPLPFLLQQVMMMGSANLLIWIPGLGYLLLHRQGSHHRVLGVTYLVFLAIMMALHAKDYYLAPIYPMLLAAGAVFWEMLVAAHARLRWVKIALPATLAVAGAATVPIVLPILPPERVMSYMDALGIKIPRSETGMRSLLPQYFADEFGWEEMVVQVASVYHSLPPEERAKTAILGGDYGSAGAIDFFGPRYGLPQSISAHQNYYYWGFRNYTGESMIMLNWSLAGAQRWCQDVQIGPSVFHPYSMGWEHYSILTCRGLKKPLAEAWPGFKVWN